MSQVAQLPRNPHALLVFLSLLAVAMGTGCHRRHVAGTVSVDSVLRAWTDAGFGTEAVKEVDPEGWNAGACSQGAVAGLDVLMCEFSGDETLVKAEQLVRDSW